MIPKKHRGITRQESENIFRVGRRIRIQNGFLVVKETTRASARVVVSVSKKSAKKATERSYVRRRIQAALSPLLDKLKSLDMLLVWTGAEAPDAQQLEKELFGVFQRNDLLR